MVDPASTAWLQDLIGSECSLAALVVDSILGWFFGSATYKYRFVWFPWVRKISLRLLSKTGRIVLRKLSSHSLDGWRWILLHFSSYGMDGMGKGLLALLCVSKCKTLRLLLFSPLFLCHKASCCPAVTPDWLLSLSGWAVQRSRRCSPTCLLLPFSHRGVCYSQIWGSNSRSSCDSWWKGLLEHFRKSQSEMGDFLFYREGSVRCCFHARARRGLLWN